MNELKSVVLDDYFKLNDNEKKNECNDTLTKIVKCVLSKKFRMINKNKSYETYNFKKFFKNINAISLNYVEDPHIYRETKYLKDALKTKNTRNNLVDRILFLLQKNKLFHQANTFVSYLFLQNLIKFADLKKEDFSEIYDKISKALLDCFKEEKEKYIKSHYISLAIFATANSGNDNMKNIINLIFENFEGAEIIEITRSFYDTSFFGLGVVFEEEEAQAIMRESQIPELIKLVLEEYLKKIQKIDSFKKFKKFFECIIYVKPDSRENLIKIAEEKYEEHKDEIESINDYFWGKEGYGGIKYKNYESIKEKVLKILVTRSLINANRNKLQRKLKTVNDEKSQDDLKLKSLSREFELISLIKEDECRRVSDEESQIDLNFEGFLEVFELDLLVNDEKYDLAQTKFLNSNKCRDDFLKNMIKKLLESEAFCFRNLDKIADNFHRFWKRGLNLFFNSSSLDNKLVKVLMKKCLLKIENENDKKEYLEKAVKLFEKSFKDGLYLEYSKKIIQEALRLDTNFANTCLKEIFPLYDPNKEEDSEKYKLYLKLRELITQ